MSGWCDPHRCKKNPDSPVPGEKKTLPRRTPSTQREKKSLDFLGLSFVTIVSLVFKKLNQNPKG